MGIYLQMRNPLSSSKSHLFSIFLVVLTVLVFLPSLKYQFINFDDPDYVTQNPYVQLGLTAKGVIWAFTTNHASNWHPLTWLSHMLDWELYGKSPMGHRFTNLLFHCANAVLLFLLLEKLTGAFWKSLVVAAIFAWHPLHIESVVWVAERKDVLSTFFWLLTLWAYTHYVRDKTGKSYFIALSLFCFGLLSKPMVVTLPFILMLLDYWPLNRFRLLSTAPTRLNDSRLKILLWEKIPFLILTVLASLITFLAQKKGGAVTSVGDFSISDRITNAAVSYLRYIGKIIWPTDLAIFYPHPPSWPIGKVFLASSVLVSVSLYAVLAKRKHPYFAIGWFWFLGVLVPVIGLVQVGGQSMADRYSYIPLIGLLIIIVWGLDDFLRALKFPSLLKWFFAFISLGACIVATEFQLRHWKNSVTLFEHALAVTRDNVSAQFSLGNALIDGGNFNSGMEHLREAMRLDPRFAEVHGKIGFALAGIGKTRDAVGEYREALRLKPNLAEALNNLTWILATAPDLEIRDGVEAVRLGERACALTLNQQPVMLGTLAAAYAEAGRYNDAIVTARKAEQVALDLGLVHVAELNQKLIELYKKREPYRDLSNSPKG